MPWIAATLSLKKVAKSFANSFRNASGCLCGTDDDGGRSIPFTAHHRSRELFLQASKVELQNDSNLSGRVNNEHRTVGAKPSSCQVKTTK